MYRTGRPGQTMCINEGLATSRRYPGLCGVYIEKDYNFFLAFMYSVFSYRSLVRRNRSQTFVNHVDLMVSICTQRYRPLPPVLIIVI